MKFLVAIHHPRDYDNSLEDDAMAKAIDDLNDEMDALGIIVFLGGLTKIGEAKSLRVQTGGDVVVTDGPYLETKEHIGGFWILDVASMDEALKWGGKAVIACRAPVEVRQFGEPPTS